MKVSTATGADAPNLKLILHFDVQGVLRLEAEDKDLFVLTTLCRSINYVPNGCGANWKETARKSLRLSLAGRSLATL